MVRAAAAVSAVADTECMCAAIAADAVIAASVATVAVVAAGSAADHVYVCAGPVAGTSASAVPAVMHWRINP